MFTLVWSWVWPSLGLPHVDCFRANAPPPWLVLRVCPSNRCQQRVGQPVRFGETIQLQHVVSRKFVTIQSSETAVVERENLMVRVSW